ncbi:hypothetical protein N9948_01205 [bacterium]|nr:hypothetical protein [bacterium]
MIQKLKNGKFRVRLEYGHNKYYKYLIRQQIKLEKRSEQLTNLKRKRPVEEKMVEKELSTILEAVANLEMEHGKPVNIKTRRSFNCRNKWQAQLVENLFKDAQEHESRGEEIPDYLIKAIDNQEDAPYREDFLEELGYQLASVSGNHPEVVENFSYSIFISQASVNEEWLEHHRIHEKEVKKTAISVCTDQETIELKGKTFLFTGAFIGITACEDYVKSLHRLAKLKKVDGIILVGPWVKYIFLHKTAENQKVLNSVKKLTEDNIKIYALRSSVESADLIPQLKELGIKFLTKIEDENNLFLNHKFSRISGKDQLTRFRDYSINKNLFVNTTYVAFEPTLRKDTLRYIIGSGASSYFTPSSRIWSNSFDSQRFNAEKYEDIGGHILRFDKTGNVYPSSFYFNHETKSIIVNGEVYSAKTKATPESADLHVMISDVHAKIMNRKAFRGFLDFLVKHRSKIKSLSINGDFFDNKLLCHHNEHNIAAQIEGKLKHKSFLHEVAHSRKVLDLILEALGKHRKNIKLTFKMGNHEVNSLKKATSKSIYHFLDTMLDLNHLLGLEKLGFEIVDGKKPYYIGDIAVYHGHEMTRNIASRVHGKESVCGHMHRGTIDNRGTILPTFENSQSADYLSYHVAPWTLGWAVFQEYKGLVTRPEFILYYNDKYFDYDKIVEVKKPIEDEIPKEINITYKLA